MIVQPGRSLHSPDRDVPTIFQSSAVPLLPRVAAVRLAAAPNLRE